MVFSSSNIGFSRLPSLMLLNFCFLLNIFAIYIIIENISVHPNEREFLASISSLFDLLTCVSLFLSYIKF